MTVAIVIAGGVGSRMHTDIPKQFIEIQGKPIIIYTLEAFQRHHEIDFIEVVCLEGWESYLKNKAAEYGISKLKWITKGGGNGQASARNGVFNLNGKLNNNDIIVFHDAIRPIIPQIIITDLLDVCRNFGNACASLPCYETLIRTDNQLFGRESIERSKVRRVQTPQAYHFDEIREVHERALTDGILDSVYANTLMVSYGKTIFFSRGFENNIKITTPEHLSLFKALLSLNEEELVK